jgi:hypothetical protein
MYDCSNFHITMYIVLMTLGQVVEKRRFATITDIRESKVHQAIIIN